MAMRFSMETVDNSPEKDLLTGAITSTPFLEQTAPLLSDTSLIKESTIRTVLRWCLEHFEHYKEAPGRLIYDIYSSKVKQLGTDEVVQAVGQMLEHLNDRYIENPENFSDQYYVSKTRKYLEHRSLEKLSESIKGHLATGDIDAANKVLLDHNRVQPLISTGIDPFRDSTFITSIFKSMKKTLFKFPYPALQELFRDVYRGDILAVAGPAKRGKSFLMSQIGRYSLFEGLNVAEFSFEMDSPVMGMRTFQNYLGESRKPVSNLQIPVFDENGNIVYETYSSPGLGMEEAREFQESFGKYGGVGELRLFDHTLCGRKVSDICDALDRIEKYEGIKIDVVVIDYDALLSPESGFRGEQWEAMNAIWRDVKAKIAQDRNTLVIFGSQYGKEGAKFEVGPESASGSSRKFDYVSHWVSILQTEAEKKAGLMRLSVVGRHDGFFQSSKVVCLQSLALARPILDARWQKDIPNYYDIIADMQEEIDRYQNRQEIKPEGKKKGWGT